MIFTDHMCSNEVDGCSSSPGGAVQRRQLLGGLGAAVVCAAIPGGPILAATPFPGHVDVHHHFGSPAYDAFVAAHPNSGAPPAPANSVQRSLENMDRGGTALAILSAMTPSVGGDIADRRRLARGTNEAGARAAADYPGRFALFASLPLPDMDGCLAELAYGVDTLGAVGVALYTEADAKYLGHPDFQPLMQELNRRGTVVFVHPHSDACCKNVVPNVPDSFIEYATSTSRTIGSLIFSEVTTRFPRIRFIFAHGGGTVPFLIERFLANTSAQIVPGISTSGQIGRNVPVAQPPGTALAALRTFHFDCAQVANPVALRALATVAGKSRILFGTDNWFRDSATTWRGVETSGVFGRRELAGISYRNAVALMPQLQVILSRGAAPASRRPL